MTSDNNLYDFILFENFHSAFHHKIDVYLIARLLKSKGLKVAILNIYGEDKQDDYSEIELLDLPFSDNIPNDKSWVESKDNNIKRLFYVIRFLNQQARYMKKVYDFIQDKAVRFYVGSYHLVMPAVFMKLNKPCYYWGLRSYRMTGFGRLFKKNPFLAFRMIYLKKRFIKNEYQSLFVSNNIIKTEFVALGVPEKRLVLREERCIEKKEEYNHEVKDKQFSLLVIGGLRRQKHVETTIEAFKNAKLSEGVLRLVGENKDIDYERVILDRLAESSNIERINGKLDYMAFNEYLRRAHFTLFADEKGASSVTNGTMMESVINYTPIIAPDYDPYSFYVKKYGLGLLYKPGDIKSYSEAIKKAYKIGYGSFVEKIKEFHKTIEFDVVANQLFDGIMNNEQK